MTNDRFVLVICNRSRNKCYGIDYYGNRRVNNRQTFVWHCSRKKLSIVSLWLLCHDYSWRLSRWRPNRRTYTKVGSEKLLSRLCSARSVQGWIGFIWKQVVCRPTPWRAHPRAYIYSQIIPDISRWLIEARLTAADVARTRRNVRTTSSTRRANIAHSVFIRRRHASMITRCGTRKQYRLISGRITIETIMFAAVLIL